LIATGAGSGVRSRSGLADAVERPMTASNAVKGPRPNFPMRGVWQKKLENREILGDEKLMSHRDAEA
jgi:hypothetical protein